MSDVQRVTAETLREGPLVVDRHHPDFPILRRLLAEDGES